MEYIEKLEKQHLRCALCQPGKKELNISENGDVYPCAPLSNLENLFMGNLLENAVEAANGRSRQEVHILKVPSGRQPPVHCAGQQLYGGCAV